MKVGVFVFTDNKNGEKVLNALQSMNASLESSC